MDDTSDTDSIASYEEIHPRPQGQGQDGIGGLKLKEERNVERLKSLILKDGEANTELAEGEVPDICYVLQYKGVGGRVYDVCRSSSPIDVPLGEGESSQQVSEKSKPVLEIITKVSTTVIRNGRGGGYYPPPGPPPRRPMYDTGDPYSGYFGADTVQHGDDDNVELKIANVEQTSMVINSRYLINALKAVVEYYPGNSGFLGDTVTINAPYRLVYHHLAALCHYRDHQPATHDEEYANITKRHINVLVDYIDEKLGSRYDAEHQRHTSSPPKALYSNLWMLYKPGEVVYAKHENNDRAPFIVSRCSNGKDGRIRVDCWNLTFSNNEFVRTTDSFTVDTFTDEAAISSLSVIPARFFCGEDGDEDPEDVEDRNVQLGRLTWELAKGPAYMTYNGNLVDTNSNFNYGWNSPVNVAGYMSGRVVVDCDGYNRFSMSAPRHHPAGFPPGMRMPPPPRHFVHHQQVVSPPPSPPGRDPLPSFAACCGCAACKREDEGRPSIFGREYESAKPVSSDAPANDLYYLVLTKTVSGFILGERRWGHFNVRYLQDIKYDREAFKHLVLDEDIKLTIRALIGKFASDGQVTPWPKDFVKNKGQGRIFLLHGSPGVGKTATCESIAELAHRPLLSLTSGDLSTNSLTVEKSLEYFLQLGERYGAMVLLDEADVYLEARRARDLARNGLVSIFLRALEYYRGVLFLTTNRVRSFDAAFTSRIHVALHYRSLTDADRQRVWGSGFERLERDAAGRVHVSVATREYAYEAQEVRALAWNGREIRNALQTAVALAEAEALEEDGTEGRVTVTEKHLRAVVKMSRGFKNFLRRRQIQDDDVEQDDYDLDDPECYDQIYE
ncbi:P-loop containing nucleoside triphosphate hydrolase protein [Apiospora phragmitis]|uniref:P-loop containing nucleoside triphosphate hydrolase protein n=1 Tax=Apiospora phragmitis TaxID=2905665 RepID=A0ABR1URR4_9PEZI